MEILVVDAVVGVVVVVVVFLFSLKPISVSNIILSMDIF